MQRVYVEATMSNGDTIKTEMNGGAAEAIGYYIGKTFNLGADGDKLVYCHAVSVDGIDYNPSTHRYISDRAHQKNKEIIAKRLENREGLEGPRLGDFLKVGEGYKRFTYDWDERGIQTTTGITESGRTGGFHLHKSGHASFSGSLDPMVQRENMELTDEIKDGMFWVFSEDSAQAHNAIYFMLPCRVYRMKEGI